MSLVEQIRRQDQSEIQQQASAALRASGQFRQQQRLGWRLSQWMAATGVSRSTLWRQIKAGDVRMVRVGKIRLIPASEGHRLGLIEK